MLTVANTGNGSKVSLAMRVPANDNSNKPIHEANELSFIVTTRPLAHVRIENIFHNPIDTYFWV